MAGLALRSAIVERMEPIQSLKTGLWLAKRCGVILRDGHGVRLPDALQKASATPQAGSGSRRGQTDVST